MARTQTRLSAKLVLTAEPNANGRTTRLYPDAKRVSPSKLDPFADKLARWLKTEAGKSRKQRRTVKQMHADLAALGYDGSYNRVAAFARVWQAKRQEAERTTEHHRRRVRFFSTVELVNMLEQEKVCNKTGQMAHRLAHMDMVVLDE